MQEQTGILGGGRAPALQERFDGLEADARQRLHEVLVLSQEQLMRLDRALAGVSPENWSTSPVGKRLELLRAQAHRAMERVGELPGSAVAALARGARGPVKNLARELENLARLVERQGRPIRSGAASAPRQDGEPAGTDHSGAELDLGR